jgi:hypothetical protein
MMSFEKENPYPAIKERYSLWAWAYPTSQHSKPKSGIKALPSTSSLMADIKRE